MDKPLVQAEIRLDAIQKNIQTLNNLTTPATRFMAVVKADAYGHGAVPVAKAALDSGADWLGVARIEEAAELRQAGITAPILVFGYIGPDAVLRAADLDLVITLWDEKIARDLSRALSLENRQIKAHLKVDTGMGRIGMVADNPENILQKTENILQLGNIELEGLYTHFAGADGKDPAYTEQQIKKFDHLIEQFRQHNITFKICHAANSAAIIKFPQAHYDMVRAGIAIYGCHPSNRAEDTTVPLFPAMTIKSIITSVKEVPKGFSVSYGMTYQTKQATRLASVPFGYADGFSRHFSSNGAMLVNGKKAPIVGRVCMDQTMIDIGEIQPVAPGDEVVIMGGQKDAVITAEELGRQIQTINYEIIASLTARVARFYPESTPLEEKS